MILPHSVQSFLRFPVVALCLLLCFSTREAGAAQAATAKQPPASAPHLKLWTMPSAQKVFREDDHAGTNHVTLQLEAAANEAEASQLVLRVTGGDVVLTNAAVAEFTPQYGVTPSIRAQLLKVEYVYAGFEPRLARQAIPEN